MSKMAGIPTQACPAPKVLGFLLDFALSNIEGKISGNLIM